MNSILIKPKSAKDVSFLQEMLKSFDKIQSVDLLDEKMVDELEDQALARAIKANRKSEFVSKSQIMKKLKRK
ncbi:MAG: hypothetical protein WCO54_00450 [Bacteroidota bacterium]